MKLHVPEGVTVEDVTRQPARGRESVLVVRRDGQDIGMLFKFKDDAWTRNPWKAFGPLPGEWEGRKALGFFYTLRDPRSTDNTVVPVKNVANPKQAALDLILSQ